MNYYQHHIGDFIRDTSRLTDSQCMAYLRLIWIYYETEEPMECDIDALAFKIGANASDVRQLTKIFFFEHNGKYHHSRCDKEILAFRDKSKKAKKSANARWDNADAMRTHTGRNANAPVFDANQEPITSNQEPKEKTIASPKQKKRTQLPADFLPNETGKAEAQAAGIDLATELSAFRNHHTSKGNTMLDWQAAWRTWVGNAVKFAGGRKQAAPAQSIYTAADRVTA